MGDRTTARSASRSAERRPAKQSSDASPVVATSTDCSPGGSEEHEHDTNDDKDDSERPQNGDGQEEAEEQQDDSDNDHVGGVPTEVAGQASGVRRIGIRPCARLIAEPSGTDVGSQLWPEKE